MNESYYKVISYKISSDGQEDNIIEIDSWCKDNKKFRIIRHFKEGFIKIGENPMIDSSYDENIGINFNSDKYSLKERVFSYPTYSYEVIEGISELDFDEIIKVYNYEYEYDDGLKNIGWELYDSEVWLKGNLDVEENIISTASSSRYRYKYPKLKYWLSTLEKLHSIKIPTNVPTFPKFLILGGWNFSTLVEKDKRWKEIEDWLIKYHYDEHIPKLNPEDYEYR